MTELDTGRWRKRFGTFWRTMNEANGGPISRAIGDRAPFGPIVVVHVRDTAPRSNDRSAPTSMADTHLDTAADVTPSSVGRSGPGTVRAFAAFHEFAKL
jgi:hypothetical protein